MGLLKKKSVLKKKMKTEKKVSWLAVLEENFASC